MTAIVDYTVEKVCPGIGQSTMVYVYEREIYYKEWGHVVIKADKS